MLSPGLSSILCGVRRNTGLGVSAGGGMSCINKTHHVSLEIELIQYVSLIHLSLIHLNSVQYA